MNDNARRIIETKLNNLSKSKFRSSFGLRKKEIAYIKKNGLDKVRVHCRAFIKKNISPAIILNDGSQTPMKNHPVFLAQHATATCCRGCLEKWYHISSGRDLTSNEENFIVCLIMEWIKKEYDEKKDLF